MPTNPDKMRDATLFGSPIPPSFAGLLEWQLRRIEAMRSAITDLLALHAEPVPRDLLAGLITATETRDALMIRHKDDIADHLASNPDVRHGLSGVPTAAALPDRGAKAAARDHLSADANDPAPRKVEPDDVEQASSSEEELGAEPGGVVEPAPAALQEPDPEPPPPTMDDLPAEPAASETPAAPADAPSGAAPPTPADPIIADANLHVVPAYDKDLDEPERHGSWVTKRRLEIVRRTYLTKTDREIMAELRATHGPKIPAFQNVAILAIQRLGLRRTAAKQPAVLLDPVAPAAKPVALPDQAAPAPEPVVLRPSVAPAPAKAVDAPKHPSIVPAAPKPIARPAEPFRTAATAPAQRPPRAPAEPFVADFEQIAAKAGEWGIWFKTWEDLGAINRHAARIGHPGFTRRMPVNRVSSK